MNRLFWNARLAAALPKTHENGNATRSRSLHRINVYLYSMEILAVLILCRVYYFVTSGHSNESSCAKVVED